MGQNTAFFLSKQFALLEAFSFNNVHLPLVLCTQHFCITMYSEGFRCVVLHLSKW